MKVNIGNYKNWFGPYQFTDAVFPFLSEETREKIAEQLPDKPFQFIDGLKKRKVKIKIDKFDTWNMDNTLALIIVPMLKQLKKTKHSIPSDFIHPLDSEMSETSQLNLFEDDLDAYKGISVKNWDMTMDHMIWAFEQIISEESEPYWVPMTEEEIAAEKADPNSLRNVLKIRDDVPFKKIDVGIMKEYEQQIEEGLMLFGKYYRSLWD